MNRTALAAACFFAFIGAGPGLAADPVAQHNPLEFWFINWQGLSNATLTVKAPNGQITDIHAPAGTPVFKLDPTETIDGVYRFELRAATQEQKKIVNQIDNGRGEAKQDTAAVPLYLSGQFTVSRGAIITPDEIIEENG